MRRHEARGLRSLPVDLPELQQQVLTLSGYFITPRDYRAQGGQNSQIVNCFNVQLLLLFSEYWVPRAYMQSAPHDGSKPDKKIKLDWVYPCFISAPFPSVARI